MSSIYNPRVIAREVAKEQAYYALTGGVINDPFWNALTVRRDLNPARFDHYHPNVAHFYVRPTVHHVTLPPPIIPPPVIIPPVIPPPVIPPPVILPPVSCPGVPHQPECGGNGAVPEPSSAVLLSIPLVFAGIVFWFRRRHDHPGMEP